MLGRSRRFVENFKVVPSLGSHVGDRTSSDDAHPATEALFARVCEFCEGQLHTYQNPLNRNLAISPTPRLEVIKECDATVHNSGNVAEISSGLYIDS